MACRADATISKIGGFSWEPPSPFLGTSSAQAHSGAIFEHHPFAALIASRRAAATLRPTGDGRAAAVLEMISPPLAKGRVREGIGHTKTLTVSRAGQMRTTSGACSMRLLNCEWLFKGALCGRLRRLRLQIAGLAKLHPVEPRCWRGRECTGR
jgi:hypothetical protein